jgi:hypothetical protein
LAEFNNSDPSNAFRELNDFHTYNALRKPNDPD